MAAVAVGCVLAFGGSAGAMGKQRVVVNQFSEPDEFAVDCPAFRARDFDDLVSGHQRTRVTAVRAAGGMLLQTVFHTTFGEADTNSESHASVGLKSDVHEVLDYAENTRTLSGKGCAREQRGGGTYSRRSAGSR